MKVPYVCCSKKLEEHYSSQVGYGLEHYRGGVAIQKGYGLGGVFRRLFRMAFPFLVKGARTAGKEVLRTGTRVASDVLAGQNLEKSLKTRSKESGKNLAQKAIDKVQLMVGKGGYKRKRKKQKFFISSKKRNVKGRDIFAE